MLQLAVFYEQGIGAPRDYVEAYKWYVLAVVYEYDPQARNSCLAAMVRLERSLTPDQLARALSLVSDWKPVTH
jgi:TPR repeat protein